MHEANVVHGTHLAPQWNSRLRLRSGQSSGVGGLYYYPRLLLVCFNVLHQHTHTNQAPDPAVGLEPRADKDGPATPLTSTRWDRVWSWVPPPSSQDGGVWAGMH